MKKLVIIGSGGFARETAWVVAEMARMNTSTAEASWHLIGYTDEDPGRTGLQIGGTPVLGTIEAGVLLLSGEEIHYFCAIGSNQARARVVAQMSAYNWMPATVAHPTCIVAADAVIGEGSYIGAGSIVCPNAKVGAHVLINVHVSVGHDASVGDFAQACPGVRISGNCVIEEQAFLGSNATIAPGVRVGSNAKVSANTAVLRNIKGGITVVGVPAQAIACPIGPPQNVKPLQ